MIVSFIHGQHMEKEELRLAELEPEHEAAFADYLEAVRAEGDDSRWLAEYQDLPYAGMVEKLKCWKTGEKLPSDWVPASTLFLMREGKIVGQVSIRHELNDFLRRIGGHIGYYIRADQRMKGYGGLILKLAMEEVRRIGLNRVLVTCDEGNIGSQKIIEKHGGVLENMEPTEDGPPKRRYWIEL